MTSGLWAIDLALAVILSLFLITPVADFDLFDNLDLLLPHEVLE
jgi:hypothetical protein